jgi:hypothetical protein
VQGNGSSCLGALAHAKLAVVRLPCRLLLPVGLLLSAASYPIVVTDPEDEVTSAPGELMTVVPDPGSPRPICP